MVFLGLLVALSSQATSGPSVPRPPFNPALAWNVGNSISSSATATTSHSRTPVKVVVSARQLASGNRFLQRRVTQEILGARNIDALVRRIRDASIKSGFGKDVLHGVDARSDSRLRYFPRRDTFLLQLRGVVENIADVQRSLNQAADDLCETIPCSKDDDRHNEASLTHGTSRAATYQTEFHDITGTMENAVAVLQDNQAKLHATVGNITFLMTVIRDEEQSKALAAAEGYLLYTANECERVKDFILSRLLATKDAALKDPDETNVREDQDTESKQIRNEELDEDAHNENLVIHHARRDGKSMIGSKEMTSAATDVPVVPVRQHEDTDTEVSRTNNASTSLAPAINFKERRKYAQTSRKLPHWPTPFEIPINIARRITVRKKAQPDAPGAPMLLVKQHKATYTLVSLKKNIATPLPSSTHLTERTVSRRRSKKHSKMRDPLKPLMEMAPRVVIREKKTSPAPHNLRTIFRARHTATTSPVVGRTHGDPAPSAFSTKSQNKKIFKAFARQHSQSRARFGPSVERASRIMDGKKISFYKAEAPFLSVKHHAANDVAMWRTKDIAVPVVLPRNTGRRPLRKERWSKDPTRRSHKAAKKAIRNAGGVSILRVKQHGAKNIRGRHKNGVAPHVMVSSNSKRKKEFAQNTKKPANL